MKIKRKLKRIFNIYNLAIVACIIIIIVSLIIIFKPNKKKTEYGLEVVDTNVEQSEEITEEEARTAAKKQFEKLGETGIKKDELNVKTIQRGEEYYYYITSANNTLEIKIKGGEITRINSATVEE